MASVSLVRSTGQALVWPSRNCVSTDGQKIALHFKQYSINMEQNKMSNFDFYTIWKNFFPHFFFPQISHEANTLVWSASLYVRKRRDWNGRQARWWIMPEPSKVTSSVVTGVSTLAPVLVVLPLFILKRDNKWCTPRHDIWQIFLTQACFQQNWQFTLRMRIEILAPDWLSFQLMTLKGLFTIFFSIVQISYFG